MEGVSSESRHVVTDREFSDIFRTEGFTFCGFLVDSKLEQEVTCLLDVPQEL